MKCRVTDFPGIAGRVRLAVCPSPGAVRLPAQPGPPALTPTQSWPSGALGPLSFFFPTKQIVGGQTEAPGAPVLCPWPRDALQPFSDLEKVVTRPWYPP